MHLRKKLKSFFVITMIFIFLMTFMFVCEGSTFESEYDNKKVVPIIMYHSFLNDESLLNEYTVSPLLFEEDLKYLTENNYETITVNDLINYVYSDYKLPEKCIMLTFDDGYYNNLTYAYPILQKYNCKAVISPIVSFTEVYTRKNDVSITYGNLSVNDLKSMLSSNLIEIQNHTYDMHSLTPRKGVLKKEGESQDLYEIALTDDLIKAQKFLKTNLKVTPKCFVYPFGFRNKYSDKVIKDIGFLSSMGVEEKVNILSKNPETLYNLGRYRRDNNEHISDLIKRINSDLQ